MNYNIRILELFGGIGACSKALERLGIEYQIVDYVEIDKYAVKSFNAIHNTNFEPQDICEWNKDIDVDLIMHGSPCQDFSLAGLQAGGDEGSGTRSSLMYETIRIVKKLKPKYVVWENVKNLLSKKHRHNFDSYLGIMESLGYKNYYQVLNAKDYGIPQNRERVFTISIRKDIQISDEIKPSVRKNFEREKKEISKTNKEIYQCECESGWQDNKVGIKVSPTIRANNNNTFILEDNIDFKFPPKQELKLKLKDILENNVNEKYYLSDKMIKYISATGTANFRNPDCKINLDIARPLTTDQNKRAGTTNYLSSDLPNNYDLIQIGQLYGTKKEPNPQDGRIYDADGLIPTLDTQHIPKMAIKNAYLRNFGSKGKLQNKEYCDTLTASMGTGGGNVPIYQNNLRIRKLTPKECWRLMGFDDEDFEKAEKVNSNTQLYKQAGNSIVVNVLMAIFKELL